MGMKHMRKYIFGGWVLFLLSACNGQLGFTLVGNWNIDQLIEIRGMDEQVFIDSGRYTFRADGTGTYTTRTQSTDEIEWTEQNNVVTVYFEGKTLRYEITEKSRRRMKWETLSHPNVPPSVVQILHLSKE